jgi:branched-subunit amino acid transport protein
MSAGYDTSLWLVFLLIGLATTLPRASFIVLGSRVVLPSLVQRALRYAPAAALAAIVVPDILLVSGTFAPLNAKLAAGIAAAAVTLLWRNPWLPFIAGMGVLLALRMGLGW